jgi:hypothetical protein
VRFFGGVDDEVEVLDEDVQRAFDLIKGSVDHPRAAVIEHE